MSIKVIEQTADSFTFEGDAVVFGGADHAGETFHKTTNFYEEHYQSVPIFYDHGVGGRIKTKVGRVEAFTKTDTVVKARGRIDLTGREAAEAAAEEFYEEELEKAKWYANSIKRLIEAGVMGLSSGSVAHLVEKDGKDIKSWPLAELSLTVIPAEKRTKEQLAIIKSLAGDPSLKALLSEDEPSSSAQGATVKKSPDIQVLENQPENNIMEEESTAFKALDDRLTALDSRINTILDLVEDSPVMKQAKMVAPGGQSGHKDVKNLMDQMIAIRNGDHERLTKVYKSTQEEGSGPSGGYTVQGDYLPGIYDSNGFANPILKMCNNIFDAKPYGKMASLDIFSAPATGATAYAGGIVTDTIGESGTYDETNAVFNELTWNMVKDGGIIPVSNELEQDTSAPIVSLLQQLIAKAANAKAEYWTIKGTGAGQPLGFMNSAAAVGVNVATDNTFAYVDALKMKSRFNPHMSQGAWIMHPSVVEEYGQFETTSGGGVFQANLQSPLGISLLGHPIYTSQFMAGQGGDRVALVDLSAYYRFLRGTGVSIAYSEHAYFTTGRNAWRFDMRCDGKPWMSGPVIASDGSGTYQVSPFVYLND